MTLDVARLLFAIEDHLNNIDARLIDLNRDVTRQERHTTHDFTG